ncbi:MAG TPA: Rho termination factor N-terminal domain-containing protein [Thermoleophilaceae bacterium]|nr:Rho termination factor N-terminal domain-containing protein [Thermoleophilaceae bacterium]
MSVLRRSELEESPLADLHAIASELGLEGYRSMRKPELIAAIVGEQGGEPDVADPAESVAPDEPEPDEPEPSEPEPHVPQPEPDEPEPEPDEPEPVELAGPTDEPPVSDEDHDEPAEGDSEPAAAEAGETSFGVLDILANGSGFLRVSAPGQGADDVYVSPAQIRRCELRAGDEVEGPVRPPRRSERHPSLVRVEQVNGAPAEPPEERPHFSDLTPVFPSERLAAPPELVGQPFGKGSRVAIGGPPGAGTSRLLREAARTLAEGDVQVSVVLAGVRPEEVTDWSRELPDVTITGGGFDLAPDLAAQAAELAVEKAKRAAERGGDTVVVIDSLEYLPSAAQRRIFAAARRAEDGGSVTVVAGTGVAWEPQRQATTRVMLDPPKDGATVVSESRSGTLRAELLK